MQVDSEGHITEGTSTNAWILAADEKVRTRQADAATLNGITRLAVLDIIHRERYGFVERSFTVEEAIAGREVFLTSTALDLLPVVTIDGVPVGNGVPSPFTRKLRGFYLAHAATAA